MSTKTQKTTLVIDDDAAFNAILVRTLRHRGYPAEGAQNGEAALSLCEKSPFEQIVLDLNLQGQSGLLLIPRLLKICPNAQILVLTGYASIATAVDAIKQGAVQYLAKPVDIETILNVFENTAPDAALLPDAPLSVNRLEWEHIQRVLNDNAGNISATARALKMHRRTLQRKLAKKPFCQ